MIGENDVHKDDTIIRPRPGGKNVSLTSAANSIDPRSFNNESETVVRSAAVNRMPASSMILGVSENKLVKAASTLFTLATSLRDTISLQDVGGLRQSAMDTMHEFEDKLRKNQVDVDNIYAARYCICSLLDEIVLNTPWGSKSIWSNQSLLATFHKDTWGGDYFFTLLDDKLSNPEKNIDLIEFMYVCLSLGFQGKYRIQTNGLRSHDELRNRLYQVIVRTRGEYERELSINWLSQGIRFKKLTQQFPLWAVIAICAAILLGTFVGFNYWINRFSDPTFNQLVNLVPDATYEPTVKGIEPTVEEIKRLREYLLDEIELGLLEVRESENSARVVIYSSDIFASGNASINESFVPLMQKIGASIEAVKGNVVVTGHTDDRPIVSAKFPSNWHLSLARATSVVNILGTNGRLEGNLIPEGRGDTLPIVPNDTPENRAKNRRVEINVTY